MTDQVENKNTVTMEGVDQVDIGTDSLIFIFLGIGSYEEKSARNGSRGR